MEIQNRKAGQRKIPQMRRQGEPTDGKNKVKKTRGRRKMMGKKRDETNAG